MAITTQARAGWQAGKASDVLLSIQMTHGSVGVYTPTARSRSKPIASSCLHWALITCPKGHCRSHKKITTMCTISQHWGSWQRDGRRRKKVKIRKWKQLIFLSSMAVRICYSNEKLHMRKKHRWSVLVGRLFFYSLCLSLFACCQKIWRPAA